MPFTYTIDPKAKLLIARIEGTVTQAERVETVMSWLTDPLFRPDLDSLCDFSAADTTPSMADLRELVDLIVRHSYYVGKVRVAIVASKPITFGVARQFAALAESTPMDVNVFSDRDAAMSWLRPEGTAT